MVEPREQARRCGVLPRGNELSASGGQTDVGLFIFDEPGQDVDGTAMDAGDISIRAASRVNVTDIGTTTNDPDTQPPSAGQGALQWSGLSVGDTELSLGDSTDVTAQVTNSATNRPAAVTARLLVNGEATASRSLTVLPQSTETVTFTFAPDGPGIFDVKINRTSTETVTVGLRTGL
jgi:hypothetical protein